MNFSKNFFLIIFLIFIFFIKIYCDEIILDADNIIFDKNQNKVFAKDNVEMKYRDILLNTAYLEYDIDNNIVYASSFTTISYYGNKLFLDNFVYNFNTDMIKASNFYFYYEPWYSLSPTAEIKKEVFLLNNAKVTHCSFKDPHYYFSSRKVLIYPKQKIKLYSNKFFIFKIPIFYLPYYEISLKKSNDYFVIEPSYDSINNFFVKSKYIRDYNKSELKFLFDTFSLEKFGLGLEYKYNYDAHIGIINLYFLENYKQSNQWKFRFSNKSTLSNTWSLKSNLEFNSNKNFNYYYEKDNWFFIKQQLTSSISLLRDTKNNSLRISYLRNDIFDEENDNFINYNYMIPFEFNIYPTKFKKFVVTNNIKIIPEFIENTTYYKINSENIFSLTLPTKFFYFSLTPNLSIKTNFVKSSEIESLYYNLYGFNLPLRYNLYSFGNLNLSYNYSIKSLNNSFKILFSSNVIVNNLSFRSDLSYKYLYFRISTLYDFLSKLEYISFFDRFSPIISDLGLNYKNLKYNLHTEYDLRQELLTNLNFSFEYFMDKNSFLISYGRNFYNQDKHFLLTNIKFSFFDKWQIIFKLSNNITKNNIELVNTNLEVYRDLHCWETKIFFNLRKSIDKSIPYFFEISGYVGLKFKENFGKNLVRDEIDKQYFPWRD